MSTNIDNYIEQFKSYRITHPNLSDCWISYLGLKKRHYEQFPQTFEANQCAHVLQKLAEGGRDFEKDELILLTLYKFICNDDIKTCIT
jgi:hypothetical protein